MIYTVIFMDYKNDLVSEVCNESPDRHAAWKNIKQEYGSVLALVPGDHPIYTEKNMRSDSSEG